MAPALQAGLWGLLGGSALLLGAVVAYLAPLPQRVIAGVMALGSGVLISALAFELMDEAFRQGGFPATAGGFLGGAVVFTAVNMAVNRAGGAHRKRSGHHEGAQQAGSPSSGLGIAVGALLDGVPESVVIGVSLLDRGGVSLVTVAAVFLSNVPEGLSSAAGMKRAGRSAPYIFGLWGGIAAASGAAAMLGNFALAGADPRLLAAVTAVAAGAILAMIVDTMIPEAFASTHDFAGLITVAGFLAAFTLSKLSG